MPRCNAQDSVTDPTAPTTRQAKPLSPRGRGVGERGRPDASTFPQPPAIGRVRRLTTPLAASQPPCQTDLARRAAEPSRPHRAATGHEAPQRRKGMQDVAGSQRRPDRLRRHQEPLARRPQPAQCAARRMHGLDELCRQNSHAQGLCSFRFSD